MQKVVYVLGAGFSAPLNIPVMGNFIQKSKDMIDAEPENYSHFLEIIDEVDKLSKAKNYYHTDLFNIEEVLSILEMAKIIENQSSLFANMLGDPTLQLLKYLEDVIKYYTPTFLPYKGGLPSNYHELMFGKSNSYKYYCYFMAALFQLKFNRHVDGKRDGEFTYIQNREYEYSIVSLNYDCVLEIIATHFDKHSDEEISFLRNDSPNSMYNSLKPQLIKIHGSVDTEILVPPTWNKQLEERIRRIWSDAYQLLSNANEIRIIGYSLPESDAYVKYLLKAASIETRNLKTIDVICMENGDTVQARYERFIEPEKSNYKNINMTMYLNKVYDLIIQKNRGDIMEFNVLEEAHSQFFRFG